LFGKIAGGLPPGHVNPVGQVMVGAVSPVSNVQK